ncbi:hypothetical protein ACS0TY_018580 [Phlomoides rotata]
MTITETKQRRRLRRFADAPKRFLRRARDFYVDSLVNFDGKVTSANIVACPADRPKDFGGYASTKMDRDKDLEELYRSITKNYVWRSVDSDDSCNKQRENVNGSYRVIDRSYSIALGKIGRIDEEEQCEFEEHVVMKSEIMFPRSRSIAVTTTNGFY